MSTLKELARIASLTAEEFLAEFGYEMATPAKLAELESKSFELGRMDFHRGYARPTTGRSYMRGWDTAYDESRVAESRVAEARVIDDEIPF